MGNWSYCCVIIKAPSDDDQAVIYYMEDFRATVLPGMRCLSLLAALERNAVHLEIVASRPCSLGTLLRRLE